MTQPQRIALVSGANRGIGLEVVRQLAAQGIRTVLGSRDGVRGEAAARPLQDAGLPVETVVLDVSDADSIRQAVQTIDGRHGRLDILVNNAGIFPDERSDTVFDLQVDTLQRTLETNLYGPLRLAQAAIPLMRRNHYGRVVNLSSGLGQLSDMGGGIGAYRISKTALNALTRILAADTGGENILVNALSPGWVVTDMGGPNASRSVQDSAPGIVWAATLPDDGPTGGFFRDGKPIPW